MPDSGFLALFLVGRGGGSGWRGVGGATSPPPDSLFCRQPDVGGPRSVSARRDPGAGLYRTGRTGMVAAPATADPTLSAGAQRCPGVSARAVVGVVALWPGL